MPQSRKLVLLPPLRKHIDTGTVVLVVMSELAELLGTALEGVIAAAAWQCDRKEIL